jgi:gliding motility-associated-like protein
MKNFIFCIFLFLASNVARSQAFHNNGSLISITTQTTVAIPDSLVNKGTIINNGFLIVSGSWKNDGTYDPGAGQINFNSSATQTINHENQSIGTLTINGGGKKEFLADITILSNLNLVNGILVSVNGSKIIMNQSAIVTGASNTSHILGPVQIHGSGNWIFPIGNGNTYLPLEVLNVTDPSAQATVTLNELVQGQANTFAAELAQVSSKRYWNMVLNAGKLDQSKIKLPLRNEDGLAGNLNQLVVAGSNAANGPYTSLGQSQVTGTLTAGTVTSTQSPSFSFFTVGALLDGIQPIEVFNAVSANEDGKNDYMRIENIGSYPTNQVSIVNRWGDRVFEITGYDNLQKSFRGESNINGNSKLPSGTYFYFINLNDGSPVKKGFLEVKQ